MQQAQPLHAIPCRGNTIPSRGVSSRIANAGGPISDSGSTEFLRFWSLEACSANEWRTGFWLPTRKKEQKSAQRNMEDWYTSSLRALLSKHLFGKNGRSGHGSVAKPLSPGVNNLLLRHRFSMEIIAATILNRKGCFACAKGMEESHQVFVEPQRNDGK